MKLKTIFTIIAACSFSFLCIEAGLFFLQLRRDLVPLVASAQVTVQKANSTLDRASTVADKVNQAADTETVYWRNTQLQVYKLVTDAKLIMIRTDRSVNDVITPRIADNLDASSRVLHIAADSILSVSDQGQQAIARVGPLLDAANAQISNPLIRDSVLHLDGAAAQLEAVAQDAHAETGLIVGRTRDAFAPKNKFLTLAKMLFGGSVSAAEFYYYMSH